VAVLRSLGTAIVPTLTVDDLPRSVTFDETPDFATSTTGGKIR